MAFAEFTLDSALKTLGVTLKESNLFPRLIDGIVPAWLPDWLARGRSERRADAPAPVRIRAVLRQLRAVHITRS